MPQLQAGKKAMRRDEKRRAVNDKRRRAFKEKTKAFKKFVIAKDVKAMKEILPSLYKAVDKAAKAGVIKANKASRIKSRLTKKIIAEEK